MVAPVGCPAPGLDRLSAGGWETITAHVHAADYPETDSRWRSLAEEAGFTDVREVFVAPSDLLRLYWMRAGAATG